MPLDPQAQRFLNIVAAGGMPDIAGLTPDKMRQAVLRLAQVVDAKGIRVDRVENRHIPGPAGSLAVRIYHPTPVISGKAPGLVYFHGGANVFCSIDTHEGLCRLLANESACRVISVDYRLAPEHRFPAAVEDAYAAVAWISAQAATFDVDAERIVVAGDSAGGTLAAVACQLAKARGGPRIARQFLLCPVTDIANETDSRRAYGERYFLERRTLAWAIDLYCPPGTDLADPRLSPLRAADLSALPAAHIHTAEFDPLRDEGRAYAEALERAGTTVRHTCHAGMIHHFYAMAGAIPNARLAISAAAAALKKGLWADQPSGAAPVSTDAVL